jgi:type I restriction enzyme S subunit
MRILPFLVSSVHITGDSIARTCIVPKEALPARVNQHVSIIRCKDKEEADYVLCYLQFLKQHLLRICKVGGTRNALTKEAVEKIEVNFSDNHKLKGKLISVINKKIELNNRINKELEGMAKLLYDYWFVQFDFPISEEQANAMDKPELKGKPYKSSGGPMVYNEQLKREVPEGWGVKNLGSIVNTELGGTPSTKKKEYWERGEFNWLNSGEIANFPIITSELSITEEAINNSATKLMPKGTVALSITRHIRPSILAIDACANQSVVGVYETESIKSSFLYPLIKNEVPRYMSLRTGAQQPHINKQTVDHTIVLLPGNDVLKSYYKLADSLYKNVVNNAFQNQQLIELRDWLLPMLMNGQVRVSSYAKASENKEEEVLMEGEESVGYGK